MNLNRVSNGIVKLLTPIVQQVYYQYKIDTKSKYIPQFKKLEEFRVKRYYNNGNERFDEHVDVTDFYSSMRALAFLFYLNDNDGNTLFPSHDLNIEPVSGRVIVFPPTWEYPHLGLPPKKGIKIYYEYICTLLLMERIETTILRNLIYDEEFSRKVIPFIQLDYFEQRIERVIFEEISKFIVKYGSSITTEALAIQLEDRDDLNETEIKESRDAVSLFTDDKVDNQWLVDTTEKWCRDRAIYLALMESISLADGKDDKKRKGCYS